MSIADDLTQLEQLRDRGSLSADEFTRAKEQLLAGQRSVIPPVAGLNGFRRSQRDRWFAGLCGGLAVSTGVDSWIWRLLFVLMLAAAGSGFLLYLVLWIFVPLEPGNLQLQHSRS